MPVIPWNHANYWTCIFSLFIHRESHRLFVSTFVSLLQNKLFFFCLLIVIFIIIVAIIGIVVVAVVFVAVIVIASVTVIVAVTVISDMCMIMK